MPSFVENSKPVPETILEVFFTIYGHGGHLGLVTWIIYIHIGPPAYKCFIYKFGFDWPSGFRGETV